MLSFLEEVHELWIELFQSFEFIEDFDPVDCIAVNSAIYQRSLVIDTGEIFLIEEILFILEESLKLRKVIVIFL